MGHACGVTCPQGLTLDSKLHPGAVPLLARLHRLRRFTLFLHWGRGTQNWSSSSTVGAALLPLLLCAPSLERMHIVMWHHTGARGIKYQRLLAAVQEGVQGLREQLQRMGRDPLMITLKFC